MAFQRPAEVSRTFKQDDVLDSSTFHWEPNIETNTEGKAELKIKAPTTPGTYYLQVEGITADGIPGHAALNLKVR